MSTITHIETSKGKFCIVPVPSEAHNFNVFDGDEARPRQKLQWKIFVWDWPVILPEGNWQLVSDKTTRNYSDDDWDEVLETKAEPTGGDDYMCYYRNYTESTDDGGGWIQESVTAAKESSESLMSHHGLSKENEYVILFKI